MNEKYTLSELEPFIREVIETGAEFPLKTNGMSMYPMLGDGTDTVFLIRVTGELDVGDIPLYKRNDGQYILHRVVAKENDGYVTRGDNQAISEHGVLHSQIIAVVCAYQKGNKRIELTDKDYLKYVKRLKLVYFKKRTRYMAGLVKNKIIRKKQC